MGHPQQYLFHPYEDIGEEMMRKSVRIPCPVSGSQTFGGSADGDRINGDIKYFISANSAYTTYIFDEDGSAATSPASSISGRAPIVNNNRIATYSTFGSFPTKSRSTIVDYSLSSIGTIDYPHFFWSHRQIAEGYIVSSSVGRGFGIPDSPGYIRLYDDTTLNQDLEITSPNGNVNDQFPGVPFIINGYIWASAYAYNEVYIFNTSGTLLTTISAQSGMSFWGYQMLLDPVNEVIIVSDTGDNSYGARLYQPDGTFIKSVASTPSQDTYLTGLGWDYIPRGIGCGRIVYGGGGYMYSVTGTVANGASFDTFILDSDGNYITDVYPKYALGASPAYPTTSNHWYGGGFTYHILHNVNKLIVPATQENSGSPGSAYVYDI